VKEGREEERETTGTATKTLPQHFLRTMILLL
jgi:hypothetical protein